MGLSMANTQKGYGQIPEVQPDLSTQVFGFPIHAPYFDMAYGVGIGASFALLPALPSIFHTCVLGPVLAVVYIRLPITLAGLVDTSVLVTDPCVMALTSVLALSTIKRGIRNQEWLLVAGPLI